jgi:hypothetical protein
MALGPPEVQKNVQFFPNPHSYCWNCMQRLTLRDHPHKSMVVFARQRDGHSPQNPIRRKKTHEYGQVLQEHTQNVELLEGACISPKLLSSNRFVSGLHPRISLMRPPEDQHVPHLSFTDPDQPLAILQLVPIGCSEVKYIAIGRKACCVVEVPVQVE